MPRFRFVVMAALWMTTFFLFLDRVNISLAAPHIMDEFGLSGIETGFILSVYYWGYIAGHLANAMVILLFELLPAEVLGIAMGIYIGLFGGLGGVAGPLILGYSYDHTGSFFWGFSGLGLGVTLVSFVLIPILFYEGRVKQEKAERAALWNIPAAERKFDTAEGRGRAGM